MLNEMLNYSTFLSFSNPYKKQMKTFKKFKK